jgi:hypothetical protein
MGHLRVLLTLAATQGFGRAKSCSSEANLNVPSGARSSRYETTSFTMIVKDFKERSSASQEHVRVTTCDSSDGRMAAPAGQRPRGEDDEPELRQAHQSCPIPFKINKKTALYGGHRLDEGLPGPGRGQRVRHELRVLREQHGDAPRLGVDVKVILMHPCIFCIENH